MLECQSLINQSVEERKKFFCLDNSGNRAKYFFMEKHYPNVLKEILSYSSENNLDHLPFKEQCYLFAHNIKQAPLNDKGEPLKYLKFSRGYLKQSSAQHNDNDIQSELNDLFTKYSQNGGQISQLLLSNDFLPHKKILEKITSFVDDLNPKLRHRIWIYKNNIIDIPKCPICDNYVKFRETHSEFASTCGNKKCYISTSVMEINWLDSLNIPKEFRNYWLFHNGKSYIVDGIDLSTKTIYEFYGDYWHGNPKYYKAEDYNTINKKTFGELYAKTIAREEELKKLGYNLITKWENK